MPGQTRVGLLAALAIACFGAAFAQPASEPATESCPQNTRADGLGACVPCEGNYVNEAGDVADGEATLCDPPASFYFSFDEAATQCPDELRSCTGDTVCFGEALAAYTLNSNLLPGDEPVPHLFESTQEMPPTSLLQSLFRCLSAFEPPPPPPPPPPSEIGGGVTGLVDITIGGLFPLTGTYCGQGWHGLFGAQKAIETLNCDGSLATLLSEVERSKLGLEIGGNTECRQRSLTVAFDYRDTEGSKPKALFDTDRLLHEGVDAIVGPVVSDVAEIAALLAKQEHVPMISYRAAMSKLTNYSRSGLDNFMRTFPSDHMLLKGVVDFIQMHHWEGLIFITTNDEYGVDAAREFLEQVESTSAQYNARGLQTIREVHVRYIEPGNPEDIRDKLEKVKEELPWRVLVLHLAEEYAPRVLHQAIALRMVKMGWCWIGTEWAVDSMFSHPVLESGEPDGLSEDGTAEYMRDELWGLVAIHHESSHPTALSSRLRTLWEAEKTEFVNETVCSEALEPTELSMVANFAYDAVMVIGSAATDLAAQREEYEPPKQGHWWRTAIDRGFDVRGVLMTSMVQTYFRELASGEVKFNDEGDPVAVRFTVVNYREGSTFVEVGTWIQSSLDYESCASDLLCGVLDVSDVKISWMGKSPNVPSDRVIEHDLIHAYYLTLVLTCLTVAIIGGNIIEVLHFAYLPEAGFTVIVGILGGLLVKLFGQLTHSHHMEELATFDEKTFALVLLPIIIFDAGFGARKRRFFGNLGPIMVTALIGTTISTVVIGTAIYLLGDITEVSMGMAESLCYGAMVSAVDPVATLAVFGVLKVEPNLNYRVFGESIINDAVSIVLFRVFGSFITKEVTLMGVVGAVGMFFKISIGSFLMGIIISLVASFVMKAAHIHDPLLAAGTFVICSYIAYEVTESMHLSGIIASLFCGFGMKHYALKNIAEQYTDMVCDMVHMLAQMADLAIFFSVGVNVILMMPYDKWTFIAVSMGLCLVGRVCNILPLCNLYNLCASEKNKIPFADQLVMVHAGLRGAIAFALALTFPTNHQKYVIDATTWIVLITVFVFGGTTVPVLKGLGIQLGCDDERKGGDEKYIDLSRMKKELGDDAENFNCKFKALLCEYKLQRCIVRTPEEELGLFAVPWDELSPEQRGAANVLGYTDDPEISAFTWPQIAHKEWGVWPVLEDEEKKAAQVLGLSESRWPPPNFTAITGADQGVKQHASGHDFGYDENKTSMAKNTTENPALSSDEEKSKDEDQE